MTEQQMIKGCKQHDRLSQRELYQLHAPIMMGVCRRYVEDEETARDLLHDGFITVFEKIEDYRGDGSFEGWMRRIFVNTALSFLRKRSLWNETSSLDEAVTLQNDGPTALQEMELEELRECIDSLSVGYKTVLNLYSVEGYSHKEIAEKLNISEETSRSQLSRAKNQLIRLIKERA